MKRYCVIGYPVGHSLSPKIHHRWFKKFRIPARYEACEVQPADLAKFMENFRERYAGANATIPHKEKIIKFLDALSPEARAIGAVNCIVKRQGKLKGYNTDVWGAMRALRVEVKNAGQKSKAKFLKGKRVIVLGAGGAARAVVYGLKKAGAKVVILNRTIPRAKKLAKEFKCFYVIASAAKQSILDCDIFINATSVGMRQKKVKSQKSKVLATPLPGFREIFKTALKKPVVMDIVYTPRITKFLRDAKKAGCKIITGDKMFLAQAAKSFELWTGRRLSF